jgi:hypothetical protein
MKAPLTNAGKNQPLADRVHYVRKRKARDQLPDSYVDALNGIDFQWTIGQSPIGQLKVSFSKLKEFNKTHGTVSFLGEDKKKFLKLAYWIMYAKSTAINMLNKDANKYVFTILRIKKMVDIGIVSLSVYKYQEHSDDTGNEQQQGDDGDDIDEEQEEPCIDEQEEQPGDEE